MSPRLLLKLALLPIKRSWLLQVLLALSFAQLLMGLWFAGSIQNEIQHTEKYAKEARFMTVQMKDETTSADAVRSALEGTDAVLEDLKTEDVLKKMETEEPDIIQTVRSIGNEGLQLMPRLLVVRGVFPDEAIEKIKLLTEVYKVEVSPVQHARLLSFYHHLTFEMKIAILLILFLVLVQLLVFHRIQRRDLQEVHRNLIAWGVSGTTAKIPAFASLVVLATGALVVSLLEWTIFRQWIWKDNAFLGVLSFYRELSLPSLLCFLVFLSILFVGVILSFSGSAAEE